MIIITSCGEILRATEEELENMPLEEILTIKRA